MPFLLCPYVGGNLGRGGARRGAYALKDMGRGML